MLIYTQHNILITRVFILLKIFIYNMKINFNFLNIDLSIVLKNTLHFL